MKIGVGSKIIISIELVVFAALILAGVSSYIILGKAYEKQTYSHINSVSSLKENNIKWFLNEVQTEIVYLNNRAGVRQGLLEYLGEGKKSSKETVAIRIQEVLTYKNLFSEIMVFDTNGTIVISTNATEEGKIKADEEYFQHSKEETHLQSYFYDISSGQPIMVVGTPIKNDKGELVGVLAGKVNVKGIDALLSDRLGLGMTGETFLVNSFNVVVTNLLKEPGMALKKTIYLPQIKDCLSGKSFNSKIPDYRGDEVFGSYRWFPEIESCLVTKIDYSEAIAPVNQNMLVLLLVLVSVGLLVGLIGYYQAKVVVVNPINQLRERVIRVKDGNFDIRADNISNDEIGEVGSAFNEMASKLKESYGELENKIKEKTVTLEDKLEELEKMNKLMVGRELTMVELKKKLQEKEK